MMTCLFHYSIDVGLLMRYLGNNYTGSHRDLDATATLLVSLDIDHSFVQHYMRLMSVGCPNHLVAKTTSDNAMQY